MSQLSEFVQDLINSNRKIGKKTCYIVFENYQNYLNTQRILKDLGYTVCCNHYQDSNDNDYYKVIVQW
jgi:hypothetical protein